MYLTIPSVLRSFCKEKCFQYKTCCLHCDTVQTARYYGKSVREERRTLLLFLNFQYVAATWIHLDVEFATL